MLWKYGIPCYQKLRHVLFSLLNNSEEHVHIRPMNKHSSKVPQKLKKIYTDIGQRFIWVA